MSALRFFVRRTRPVAQSPRVHIGDPLRLTFAICGIELDGNYRQTSEEGARMCGSCEKLRATALERLAQARGIVGGWEAFVVPFAPVIDTSTEPGSNAWIARDALDQQWVIHLHVPRGRSRATQWTATIMTKLGARHVRKYGQTNRATWRTDAIAMRQCEDMACSGEYVLDRPVNHNRGAA